MASSASSGLGGARGGTAPDPTAHEDARWRILYFPVGCRTRPCRRFPSPPHLELGPAALVRSPFPASLQQKEERSAMAVSLERLAHNQVLFREVNERLREKLDGSDGATEFLCECSRTDCIETVVLTIAEYES